MGSNPVLTLVILSTPPHINTFPAPNEILPAAIWIASIEEPHHLSTVIPEVLTSILVKNVVSFPILNDCSPVWNAQPTTISSISSFLTLDLETKFLITSANKFTGFVSMSAPFLAIVKGDLEKPAITGLNIIINIRLIWKW